MGATKDKAQETAEAAKNVTSRAAQSVKESKDQTGSYLSEKTGAAKEKTSEAAESAKPKDLAGKEKTPGILQQTGERVKNMAQSAADAVKNTVGMGKDGE